jgi:hypothetical protein
VVVGGEGEREGPATGLVVGTVGEMAGGTGPAGVLFREDARRVTAGTAESDGEGAASSFIGTSSSALATSSGNTVTPGGGGGRGIEGNRILSSFDDLPGLANVSATRKQIL